MKTPSVQDVGTRGWVTTLVSSRKTVISVMALRLNRSCNWPPPSTEIEKNKEKKATASSSAPTLVDPAHVSVLGKVEG